MLKCWIVVSNHDMPRLAERLPDLEARGEPPQVVPYEPRVSQDAFYPSGGRRLFEKSSKFDEYVYLTRYVYMVVSCMYVQIKLYTCVYINK